MNSSAYVYSLEMSTVNTTTALAKVVSSALKPLGSLSVKERKNASNSLTVHQYFHPSASGYTEDSTHISVTDKLKGSKVSTSSECVLAVRSNEGNPLLGSLPNKYDIVKLTVTADAPIVPPDTGAGLDNIFLVLNVNEFVSLRLDMKNNVKVLSISGLPAGLTFVRESIEGVTLLSGVFSLSLWLSDNTTVSGTLRVNAIRRIR